MQQIMDTNPDIYIEERMKQFHLVDMREQYHELIEDAKKENLGYKDFLIRLLQAEEAGKANRRSEKLLLKANFDSSEPLTEIDYSFNPSLDKDRIDELGRIVIPKEIRKNLKISINKRSMHPIKYITICRNF